MRVKIGKKLSSYVFWIPLAMHSSFMDSQGSLQVNESFSHLQNFLKGS